MLSISEYTHPHPIITFFFHEFTLKSTEEYSVNCEILILLSETVDGDLLFCSHLSVIICVTTIVLVPIPMLSLTTRHHK